MRKPVDISAFTTRPYDQWENRWLLLSAGDFAAGKYNSMVVGWGSFGVMWGRPFAMVVVRPHRYTFEFMEQYDSFTLTAFDPKAYRSILRPLGVKSGRDIDKVHPVGLTPQAGVCVASPTYAEAWLSVECRKIYWQDLDPAHFLIPEIAANYPREDYHRVYYGEILHVEQTEVEPGL